MEIYKKVKHLRTNDPRKENSYCKKCKQPARVLWKTVFPGIETTTRQVYFRVCLVCNYKELEILENWKRELKKLEKQGVIKKARGNRYYSIINKKQLGGKGSKGKKEKQITERELNILKQKYAKIRIERKREKKKGYDLAKFELEYI